MENLRKLLRAILKIAMGSVLIVTLIVGGYYFYAISPIPHIKVCKTLGRNPWTDPDCRDTEGIFAIISERFPTGTTTRDEVQSVLGEYHTVTHKSRASGNWVDLYHVTPFILNLDGNAEFEYDENDILIEINFYD
jgi:hypothetical protein